MEHHYQYKAAFYKEGRQGYAPEAVQLITETIGTPRAVIADMGSGTGIFSASLLKKGCVVYCVEPDADLRQKASERLRHFKHFMPIAAPAEDTRLPNHSVDGITAASAFHWFDPEIFLRECKRIIKPDSPVFFLYNVRPNDDPFSQEQSRVCRQYCPGFTSFCHGADKAKKRCPAFFSDEFKEKHYSYDLIYTKEQFLSRCLSSSYSLNQTQPDYPAYRRELEKLIASYSIDGLITIRNYTVVWYGMIK
ncbi:MAG: class I SAM-dependent methyltransferase [Oscillospiraceae bacterium]|jgi:ubiquinone/menaquinone biosynthesis C-methylase UbiE|nr:class I SAM-dependent methyltransferase [Oscillospiraceae bacterium]